MTATEPRLRARDLQSLLAVEQDDSWRDEAACRDLNPGLFYPVGTTGPAVTQIHQAKRICAQCPVRGQCLEYALATNQDHGVWGGASEEERRRIRRARRLGQPDPDLVFGLGSVPERRECVVCLGSIPDRAPDGAMVCSPGCCGKTFCRNCFAQIPEREGHYQYGYCGPDCRAAAVRRRGRERYQRRKRETADA